jgi:N-dimethylarginine dimethylaminohydrolase
VATPSTPPAQPAAATPSTPPAQPAAATPSTQPSRPGEPAQPREPSRPGEPAQPGEPRTRAEPGTRPGIGWGRRFLMCPPHHFGVLYEINPWMQRQVRVEHDRARAQWQHLVDTLRAAGAEVLVMEPQPDVPDLVFTANAGVVNGGQFVPSHFRHPERQPETAVDAAWFAAHGWRVDRLPDDLRHEGAGDALPFTGGNGRAVLLSGYSFRSDALAAAELSRLLACPVRPVQLVDTRLYHLDLTFCPLDDRRAIVAPGGWDAYGRKVVEALVPEPLVLDTGEALAFCANSVVVGTTVVMPAVPVRVGRQLEAWGFTVAEVPVGEFLKAGGGCRCLTLALDVTLSPSAPELPGPNGPSDPNRPSGPTDLA